MTAPEARVNMLRRLPRKVNSTVARLVRGATLSLKEQEFVMAARGVGASNMSIMFRHILPNIVPVVLIVISIRMGSVILLEATLSFLRSVWLFGLTTRGES